MPGKPISKVTADTMIQEYIGYMSGLGVDMENQTQSVSFTATTVMGWLNRKMTEADELKVFMGLYPPGHVKAGHTSVILWPYKNGQPLVSSGVALSVEDGATQNGGGTGGGEDDAFNDGSGTP
jgi:hypothetical protein